MTYDALSNAVTVLLALRSAFGALTALACSGAVGAVWAADAPTPPAPPSETATVIEPALAPTGRALLIDPRALEPGVLPDMQRFARPDLAAVAISVAAGMPAEACFAHMPVRTTAGANSPALSFPDPPPAGRFDLDTGLRHVAEALQFRERSARITIIASGPSQCLSVGCALGAWLKAEGRDLQIDIVALDPAAESLRCLAENTDGRFELVTEATAAKLVALLSEPPPDSDLATLARTDVSGNTADSAVEMESRSDLEGQGGPAEAGTDSSGSTVSEVGASVAAVPHRDMGASATDNTQAASGPPMPLPPVPLARPGSAELRATVANGETENGKVPEAPEEDAKPKPFAWTTEPPGAPEAEPPPGASGIRFRVVAGPSGPLVETDLAFEILVREGNGSHRVVAESWAASPFFTLPAGDFVARVSHSGVVRQFSFTSTNDGVDLQTLSLDIGYLGLKARPTDGASALESGVTFTVSRLGNTASGAAIIVRRDAQPTIALPAGRYRILAQTGAARATADVTVTAGMTATQEFDLDLGYLRVQTVSTEPDAVQVRIRSIPGQLGHSPKLLSSEVGNSVLFRVPAGRMMIIVQAGRVTARRTASVQAGKLTIVSLDIQSARLRTSSPRNEGE